jgi:outer membrane cobalamin receptor
MSILKCPTRRGAATLLLLLIPDIVEAQSHPRSGSVLAADTRVPIAGVQVTGGRAPVYTDSLGRFTVIADDSTVLRLHRLGFRSTSVPAASLAEPILLHPQPTLLSEVVVSSTGTDLGRGSALSTGTVFRAAVDEVGGSSLAERLEGVEGLSVQRMGEWGSRALLRGLGGERITVMVDGARVNRACTFGMDQGLSTVNPSSVERVEVLSGPGSTLYGSGNVGGVINVVTRRPPAEEGWSGALRVGGSSAVPGATVGLSAGFRGARMDGLISADAASFGDYMSGAGKVSSSSYRDATLSTSLGYAPTASQRLSVQGTLYEGRDIGWPAMAGASIPLERRIQLATDYGWQLGRRTMDAFSARVYVQRLDHHMEIDMTMPATGMNGMPMTMRSVTDARSTSTTAGVRSQLRLIPTAKSRLDLGLDGTRWAAEATRWNETLRLSSSGSATPVSQATFRTWPAVRVVDLGLFTQGELDLTPRVTVMGGARIDRVSRNADNSDATSERVATGNVGVETRFSRGFSTRVAMGLGFRVPDPTELYGVALRPDGFIYRGTPSLESETNRNVEASLQWERLVSAGQLNTSLTVFRNDLAGLIAPRLAAGDSVSGRPVREYANIADARIAGLSASAALPVSTAISFRGSLTWTRGQNLVTSTPLALTPPLEGVVALRMASPWRRSLWLEVESRMAGRQERIALDAGERVAAGYGILNLRGSLTVAGTHVVLGVENLLDRSYRAHVDPQRLLRPGRNVFARLLRDF